MSTNETLSRTRLASTTPSRLKTTVVTGAAGFIGQNLTDALLHREDVRLHAFDKQDHLDAWEQPLATADVVFHLAGVNRPKADAEFQTGNVELTRRLLALLASLDHRPVIVFPSSIHAAAKTPYGRSKREAEDILLEYGRQTDTPVRIYRLPNVFGKWSRPSYNSVVATFCYNIARNQEISISDPDRQLELVYIDDVVSEFLSALDEPIPESESRCTVRRTFRVSLSELADRIRALNDMRERRLVPDMREELTRCLHATFTSFLPPEDLGRVAETKTDERGWLFEMIKSSHAGQIFVSKTLPGITRGNHYHHSKVEKFCVVKGEGTIRLRHLPTAEVHEYDVSGREIKVVDVPPGFTHSITNTGKEEMLTLFWANEVFDPDRPDTYFCEP